MGPFGTCPQTIRVCIIKLSLVFVFHIEFAFFWILSDLWFLFLFRVHWLLILTFRLASHVIIIEYTSKVSFGYACSHSWSLSRCAPNKLSKILGLGNSLTRRIKLFRVVKSLGRYCVCEDLAHISRVRLLIKVIRGRIQTDPNIIFNFCQQAGINELFSVQLLINTLADNTCSLAISSENLRHSQNYASIKFIFYWFRVRCPFTFCIAYLINSLLERRLLSCNLTLVEISSALTQWIISVRRLVYCSGDILTAL